MPDPAQQRPDDLVVPEDVQVRLAQPGDVDVLVDIDDDATTLYASYGLDLQAPQDGAFAAFAHAERDRWRAAAARGRVYLAVDAERRAVGFAALDILDHAPYLDQLAVRRTDMRRGIGRLLLAHAMGWAVQRDGSALWLTTYAHLPFNGPYYERLGFVPIPEDACGPDVRQRLEEQRRVLPAPGERVAMRRAIVR